MRARKFDGQIDQIINIIKTELSIPAKKRSNFEEVSNFAEDIIKKLNSRYVRADIKEALKILKSNFIEKPLTFQRFPKTYKSTLWKKFSQKLQETDLVNFAEESFDHTYEGFRNPQSSFSSSAFEEMRNNFFGVRVEITQDNNIQDTHTSIENLMTAETATELSQYLETIKASVRDNNLDFKEHYQGKVVGRYLFDQLQQFAKTNENKNIIDIQKILEMSLGDFLTCLLKTNIANLRESNQNNNFIKNWNIREYKLLANLPTIIENIELLTRTTKNPKIDDEIKKNKKQNDNKETFDAVILNLPFISPHHTLDLCEIRPELSLLELNSSNGKNFEDLKDYRHYKTILSKRLLPVLIELNARHNKGFIFSIPDKAFFNEDSFIYNNFILALNHLLKENVDLLPNLKGVICPELGKNQRFVSSRNEQKTIPFITTKKHIEPTKDNNQFIINQFVGEVFGDLPKNWDQFDVVVGLAGHAFARPGYEFNDKMTSIQQTPLSRCTTLLTKVTGGKGQLYTKTNDLLSYEPSHGSWNDKFKENTIPTHRVSIISVNNKHADLLSSTLYNSASELILSKDFDYDEVKKARLCAIYSAMKNSKNEGEKNFAKDLEIYFTDAIIKKYQENYPLISLSQTLLTELSNNFQTKNNDTKNYLITYLKETLKNPKLNTEDFSNLIRELGNISNCLRKQEWISFFGQHRLRHSIDNFRHKLEKYSAENEQIVKMDLYNLTRFS